MLRIAWMQVTFSYSVAGMYYYISSAHFVGSFAFCTFQSLFPAIQIIAVLYKKATKVVQVPQTIHKRVVHNDEICLRW